MRLLFFIVLLLNAAAFGYIRFAESRAGADSQIALLQIAADKIKLLKPGTVATDSKDAARTQAGLACLEWGGFANDEAVRAAAALDKFALGDKVAQRKTGDSYWVYIPPFKTRAEAEKKVGEVKALGVTDFYLVSDNDQWQFAISLGMFKTEEAATNYLGQLKQRGVRSAQVGPRGVQNTVFVIRDPGDPVAAQIAALKADFPNAQLKAAPCAEVQQAAKSP
jgi:hypothetical protein